MIIKTRAVYNHPALRKTRSGDARAVFGQPTGPLLFYVFFRRHHALTRFCRGMTARGQTAAANGIV